MKSDTWKYFHIPTLERFKMIHKKLIDLNYFLQMNRQIKQLFVAAIDFHLEAFQGTDIELDELELNVDERFTGENRLAPLHANRQIKQLHIH